MLNLSREKALYPIIKHYTGMDVYSVYEEENGYRFTTVLGEDGEINKSFEGDWDIIIENKKVESIEDIVFNILVLPEEKSEMSQFIKKAKGIIEDSTVRYQSKILLDNIIKILEEFVLNSEYVPNTNMIIPPFWVCIYKGRKFINGLN